SSRGPEAAICAIAKSAPRSKPRIIASAMLPAPTNPIVLSIDMLRWSILRVGCARRRGGPTLSRPRPAGEPAPTSAPCRDRFGQRLRDGAISIRRVVARRDGVDAFVARHCKEQRGGIDDCEILAEHVQIRLPRIAFAAKLRG